MKTMVFRTPVRSEEDLIALVHGAIKSYKTITLMRQCANLNTADVGGTAMT